MRPREPAGKSNLPASYFPRDDLYQTFMRLQLVRQTQFIENKRVDMRSNCDMCNYLHIKPKFCASFWLSIYLFWVKFRPHCEGRTLPCFAIRRQLRASPTVGAGSMRWQVLQRFRLKTRSHSVVLLRGGDYGYRVKAENRLVPIARPRGTWVPFRVPLAQTYPGAV